jgi:hypothetical protein
MDRITTAATQIHYPESDGKPMGATDVHIDALIYLREALRDYFRDDPLMYVAGNMLLYYEEGNPSACVAPDVFVVQGVAKGQRRTYRLWDEANHPLWSSRSPRGCRGWKTWASNGRSTPCWECKSIFCMIRWANICGRRCKATGCRRGSISGSCLGPKAALSARPWAWSCG